MDKWTAIFLSIFLSSVALSISAIGIADVLNNSQGCVNK